jgi:hypothetical protein
MPQEEYEIFLALASRGTKQESPPTMSTAMLTMHAARRSIICDNNPLLSSIDALPIL